MTLVIGTQIFDDIWFSWMMRDLQKFVQKKRGVIVHSNYLALLLENKICNQTVIYIYLLQFSFPLLVLNVF